MDDAATIVWTLVVIGGPILLGLVVIYGIFRSRRRSRAEAAATERRTKELYNEEERADRGS